MVTPCSSISGNTKPTGIDSPELTMAQASTKTTTNSAVNDEKPDKPSTEDPAAAAGKAVESAQPAQPEETQNIWRSTCLVISAFVAMFLVALDRTIISTV